MRRRGEREGEALWKAREDVMGDGWALENSKPRVVGRGAARGARAVDDNGAAGRDRDGGKGARTFEPLTSVLHAWGARP